MKKLFNKTVIAILFVLSAGTMHAQKHSNAPAPWVSDMGYWMIKGNIHDPLNHTIYFYTNENLLVHTEYITGMKLNTHKKEVKMMLKKALEKTLALVEQHKKEKDISSDLVAILKIKR